MHWIPPTDNFTPLLWAREFDQTFSKYSSADVRQYFADISPTNRVWKKPRSALKWARKELHNETNDHIHDKYLGGDIVKLVVFSLLAYNTTYENVTKIAQFSQYFAHISSKNRTCKKIRSAIQRACRGLHIDTSYYFQGGRVGGIRLGRS